MKVRELLPFVASAPARYDEIGWLDHYFIR
jgi:hypothetical protein